MTPVDEYTLDVQCSFIPGSDAIGCQIVLDSDHSNIERENATLKRKPHTLYASGRINLTHKAHRYVRLFAFNIDANNSTSNFSIEKELLQNANFTCSGNKINTVVTNLTLKKFCTQLIMPALTQISSS